jgi:hypothetical protein
MSQSKLVIPYRKNERKRFFISENHREKKEISGQRERKKERIYYENINNCITLYY